VPQAKDGTILSIMPNETAAWEQDG
jgi:hypothetical protein